MSATIGLILDGPRGDNGFVDASVEAVRRVAEDGIDVQICEEPPRSIPPAWTAVLAHGSSLTEWALEAREPGRTVVLSDRPENSAELTGIHFIDWAWDEGYEALGMLAAAMPGAPVVTLVTGPDFPPQRRIAAAFVNAFQRAAPRRSVHCVSLGSFTDEAAAVRAFPGIVERSGRDGVVVSSAGRAGDRLCELAQSAGLTTFGFSALGAGHTAWVTSDIAGIVESVLRAVSAGQDLPGVVHCGLGSGFLSWSLAAVDATVEAGADDDAGAA